MTEQEEKTAFALALLKMPDDPYKAAFSVIPDNGRALQAVNIWVHDPFVKSEKMRLIAEMGEKSFLPTKEDQAKAVWLMANDVRLDEDSRHKFHRLYAEIMGNIEKPQQGNTTQILNQGVMIVRDHGSDKQWEIEAKEQQRTLIGHGAPN